MSRGRFQLAGARGARHALDTLERLAGPIASLCQAAPGVGELVVGAPAELLRTPLANAMETLASTLDSLDGAAAPTTATRSRSRERLAATARIERPRLPTPNAERPRRAAPPPLPLLSAPATGASAIVDAWRDLAISDAAATPAPRTTIVAPRARRPLPAASSDPGAALTALIADVPGAAAARARPIALAPTPMPRPIADARANAEPSTLSPPPQSRTDLSSNTAPARPDALPPAPSVLPADLGPAPRGLSGLAGWWRDHGQPTATPRAAEPGATPRVATPSAAAPPLPAVPLITTPSPSARLAGFDSLSAPSSLARPEPDAPALAALGSLDDVTRALERVLVRELRRHGVPMEEP